MDIGLQIIGSGGLAAHRSLPNERGGRPGRFVITNGRKDCVADQFRDLRDYGVSEGCNSVCVSGKPISFSTNKGLIQPVRPRSPSTSSKFPCGLRRFQHLFHIVFRGVGNKPDTFSTLRSANAGCWNVSPFRIIPALGQVSKNSAKPSAWPLTWASKQVCDVLHDDEPGSYFANQTDDFGPEAAARAFNNANLLSRATDILAWEPTCNDINGINSICAQSFCGKGADIVIAGDIGPVLGEDFARERFDFAEGDGFKSACSFKAKGEPSDSREKIEDAQLAFFVRFVIGPHRALTQQHGDVANEPGNPDQDNRANRADGDAGREQAVDDVVGWGIHAASPERVRNSARQTANETSPDVCKSMALAVSESGNLSPLRYRFTDACDLPISSASAVSVFSGRSRYAAKAS